MFKQNYTPKTNFYIVDNLMLEVLNFNLYDSTKF